MRLRNKNWTKEYIENHQELMINFDSKTKINLQKSFKNKNKVFALEIGAGKGQFVLQQSLINLETNYVAMEKEQTVVGVALKKVVEKENSLNHEISNIKFLNTFAENLTTIFSNGSFDIIYLNFSDPWPKAKHFKKRLTYRSFLDQYFEILTPNGTIEIKTDNDQLFAFSISEIETHNKFEIIYKTTDLYQDKKALKTNVPTEYETKFHQAGKNINKLILKRKNFF